ncbi:MAG: hypothetical protein JHD16_00820 [Solirubrobacteraceae bacterium]|nr:hypothetical protein [Solirubrobacteraceae bacterium]
MLSRLDMHTGVTFTVCSAVATASPRGASSQDRAGAPVVAGGAAAVLCDGVGSLKDSSLVAELALAAACDHITAEGVGAGIVSCPGVAAEALAGHGELPDGATTLVAIGADEDGHVCFTLVGNGSIFAIEPLSVRDGRAQLLFGELALPHMEMVGAQAALRSVLPAQHLPVEATAGGLLPRPGRTRLLLACTDGITSAEERDQIGKVESTGQVWAQMHPPFVEVLEVLSTAWGDLTRDPGSSEALERALESALESCVGQGLLDDDASVGAVLVAPVPEGLIPEDAADDEAAG